MFFFKTSVTANYEKKIYDFSIESISGEVIDFKDYKNKVILVVNTAVIAVSQNNMMNYRNYGNCIKRKG